MSESKSLVPANRAQRRKMSKRRVSGIAGMSLLATTGLMGAYLGNPRLPRAYAAPVATCAIDGSADVANQTELDAALSDPLCTTVTLTGDIPLTSSLTTIGDAAWGSDRKANGLTVDGAGNSLTGDATSTSAFVLALTSVQTSDVVVNIQDLTVSDMYTTDSAGGSVLRMGKSAADTFALRGYLSGVIFEDNYSLNGPGGAVSMTANFGAAYLDISSSDLQSTQMNRNKATGDAGGAVSVRVFDNGRQTSISVSDASFSDNYAFGSGGAIYDYSFNAYATVDISTAGSTVSFGGNESADAGGAIYAATDGGSSSVYVQSPTTFQGNTAAGAGGAIGARIVVVQGADGSPIEFTSNQSTAGNGGAIVAESGYVQYATFVSNYASDSGGAIYAGYLTDSADYQGLDHASFRGNTAGGKGGAVDAYVGANVSFATFDSNSSSADGGGLYIGDGDVGYSTFRGNTAIGNGGGLALYSKNGDASLTIGYSTFSGNAGASGGGIGAKVYAGNMDSSQTLTITNSTLTGNSATGGNGGAIVMSGSEFAPYVWSSDLHANAITMAYNHATLGDGAGIYTLGNATIDGSVVYGNNASNVASFPDALVDGDFELSYSLLTSGTSFSSPSTSATGVITGVSPRLGLLGDHGGVTETFLPEEDSPVLDAGNPAIALTWDQRGDGFQRVVGLRADIGSVEFGAVRPKPELSQLPPSWHQSTQRKTPEEPCPSGMNPSWAEWPNNGAGGWTCEMTTWWDVNKGTHGGWVTTPGLRSQAFNWATAPKAVVPRGAQVTL